MTQYPSMSAPEAPELVQPVSSWPKVIGILSIVLGSIGILYYLCGAGGALMTGMMTDVMGDMMSEAERADLELQLAAAEKYMIPTVLSHVFAMLLAVLLLVVGIALVRRRRWSRSGALLWAGGKMVHALAAGAVGWVSTQATIEAMQSSPDMQQMPQGMQGFMAAIGPISAILTAAFLLVFPVFMVIWFNRGKIVEEVRTWS